MEHHRGAAYRLVYDADRTKIDWGLTGRLQATHFLRVHPNAGTPTDRERLLLELADVAAYTLGQALTAIRQPNSRRAKRFLELAELMRLASTELHYSP
jgi:hypothetical protein